MNKKTKQYLTYAAVFGAGWALQSLFRAMQMQKSKQTGLMPQPWVFIPSNTPVAATGQVNAPVTYDSLFNTNWGF